MKKRTRMLVIVLVMLLVTSVLPIEAGAYNTGDDYPEWIYCPVYLTEKDLKNSPIDTVQDPWNFWNRECTSFVAWCLNTRNHVEFTNQYKGVSRWGHAKEWINAANQFNDIIVDNNPGLGSVAWWGGGTYGHVAWVSSINGDGTITIEEYNNYEVAGASGIYSTRTISTSNVDKFIHIKDLDVTPPTVSSCVNVSNVSSNGFTLQFTATDDFGVTSVWADVRPGFSDAGAHRFQGNLSGSTATVVVETDLVAALSGSSSQNYYVTCGARDASENTAEVHVEHERISVYPVEIHSTGLNKTTGTFKTMQDTAGHYEPCEEIDGKSTESFFYAKGASVSGVGVYTNQWGATYLLTANGDWLYADHVKYQMQWSDIWDAISSFFNGNVTKIVYFAGQPLKSMETANQAKAPARLLAASNPSSIKLYGNVTTSTNSSGSYAVPSYKVYFDANGGSVSSSYKTVFANSTYGTLPTPYRLGYTFDGWFTAAEGGSLVTDATLISNSDHTLYAHWTRIVLLQGSCGANLSFILYGDGEMIVTGSGAMTSHPWTANAYRERVVDVSLPQDLTALCNSAFQNCTYLQTINLPNAETIPYYCFSGCSYLQTIALPSTLWAIDYHAFENCTALASIDIPDSVLYIGGYAFNGCSSLASVRLSENLKLMNGFISNAEERTWSNRTDDYYNGAFRNCTSLKEITIPKNLTTASQAFIGCTNLSKVTLEEGMTTVAYGLFYNCPGITEITIPADVTTIQSYAFRDADNLKKVTMGNAVTSVGAYAFYHCDSLESINLSKSLQTLGDSAFSYCVSLPTINIPRTLNSAESPFSYCSAMKTATFESGVDRIVHSLFYNCTGLESVALPSTLWAIDYEAFENCTSLASIDIPDSVLYIGGYAFNGCSSLASVRLSENLKLMNGFISNAEERTWSNRTDNYYNGAFRNCTSLKEITIPKNLTSAYQAFIGCTNLSKVTLEEGMTTVAYGLFYNCPGITEITIPADVTTIQSYAFRDADNLKKVTMGNAVTSIGDYAFYHCDSLESINLSKSLQTLGDSAFSYCVSLPTINIPRTLSKAYSPFSYCSTMKTATFESGVDRIVHSLFYNCTGLESVALPSTLWAIDYEAFENCTSLASIDIPDSVLYIGGYAFNGCSSLASVRLSENLKLMNGFISNAEERTWSNRTDNYYYNGAFRNCTSLKEIVIPASLARVPDSSFSGCSQMQSVTFKGTETSIYSSCFSGCKMLTDISLPAALKEIPSSCFKDCDSLVDITLPDTVKTIGSDAFNDCDGLQKIIFNPELSTIGSYAFNDCDSLKEVRSNAQLSSIGSYAFNECDLLETVELQMGLTSLGSYAFYKCPKISSLVLPQSLQSIGANCFAYDSGLTTVTIPDSVTSLGDLAFYLCDGLKNLGLGTGLTTIPQYCFWKNTSLEEVVIPYRVKTIEANAFANCTKLAKLTLPRSVTSIGTSAFSYADRMTVYGISGTYAETWAKNNGFEFSDNPVHAETVELIPSELTIIKGGTHTLALAVDPDDFTDEVSWKSSNESIATINDSGLVTAKALGSCFIKVIVGSKNAVCNITVVQPVTSISLNMTSKTLEAFETMELKATVNPSTANIKDVVWSISNPTVATMEDIGVDANGRPGVRITALTAGTTTITCKATDGSEKYATCTVTVSNVGHVVEDVSEFESSHNYSNNSNEVWQYTYPGETEQLYVSFDGRTALEDGFDSLIIYAGSTKVGEYTGTSLQDQTITVPGNVVRIRLKSDGSGNDWGFKVKRVSPTNAETLEDFTVTIPDAMSESVTITAPEGGWVIGENTFTVESEKACVLLVTNDGGQTYTRLKATASGDGYAFTADLTADSSIVCARKGDISGDGTISALEARQILMAGNGLYTLTPLQRMIADTNGDGTISALEARQILMAGNGLFTIGW